jgi:hypothetical protein
LRFGDRNFGERQRNIIRDDGLHQGRRETNRLPLAARLSNAPHEFEELRGANVP